jgi:hypothetical protein
MVVVMGTYLGCVVCVNTGSSSLVIIVVVDNSKKG